MSRKKTQDEFINEATTIHNGKYDYSNVEYVNTNVKVKIICPIHGEFEQKPYKHLQGQGCLLCAREKDSLKKRKTTTHFIERAFTVHGEKYDYTKSNYVKYKEKITIICPKHGEFQQTVDDHLQGKGCPICGHTLSKPQQEIISFLQKYNIEIINNYKIPLCGLEIDIFLPQYNIGIEYHGLRWHSELYNKDKEYHIKKLTICQNYNIKLIQIFEDEYINNKEIVLSKLQHIINIPTNKSKIYGRNCSIEIINHKIAKDFLNKFHIQGFSSSTVYLGAVYDNKLIAVMSFKKEGKSALKWELTRFASDYNYICCGVGGKLFNWFIKNYNPTEVKSFADRRWTVNKENNLYTKLGFNLVDILKQDYRYYAPNIDKNKRFHKFLFRKQRINKKYGLSLELTETEMAKIIGAYKIWDCGLLKYVYTKKE